MNIKGVGGLAWFLQFEMEQDMIAEAEVTAEAATEVLREVARDDARAKTAEFIKQARDLAKNRSKNEDDAEAKIVASRANAVAVAAASVEMIPATYDSGDVPSLEWCSRIAMKHAVASKRRVGKQRGLREEILDRVKRDPDSTDKGRGNGR